MPGFSDLWTWGLTNMHQLLEKEEAALRRRALFRLLRRFDFDAPEFKGEAISDPVPASVSAAERIIQALCRASLRCRAAITAIAVVASLTTASSAKPNPATTPSAVVYASHRLASPDIKTHNA